MKTTMLAALVLVTAAACSQKTETSTTVDTTGHEQSKSSTTVTTTMPAIDSDATAQAKQNLRDLGTDIKKTAKDAAHATGTALESAGKTIQKKTGK